MDINYETGSASILELEGVPIMEEGCEFSPLANIPIIDYSIPMTVQQPSSQDPYFDVQIPGFNHFQPDDTVAPMFEPNSSFWETALGQVISEFGATSATNVFSLELTPNPRKFYLFLCIVIFWVDI